MNASTSFIALFLLPRVANRSTFAVRNTRGGGDPSLGASVIGAIGQTRFVDSAVIAKDVSATAMLLFAAVAPLVLEGSYTSLTFENVTVLCANYSTPSTTHPPNCRYATIRHRGRSHNDRCHRRFLRASSATTWTRHYDNGLQLPRIHYPPHACR